MQHEELGLTEEFRAVFLSCSKQGNSQLCGEAQGRGECHIVGPLLAS